jgi:RNA polymerase sigma factor (sigma-70 family)
VSWTVPELAERVEQLRPSVLASKRREFPRLAHADLEDAYSQAVEGIIRGDALFEEEAQLAAYLHRAVSNLARNQIRDTARHAIPLEQAAVGVQARDLSTADPEDRLLAAKARALLNEFLAELSEQDRTIAYLHLDPAYECTPRQIARELNVPYQQVRASLRRTSVNLSRFQALLTRPGAFCQRRRRDVLEWQRTGVVPLALRIHLSRCATCRARHRTARTAVRRAILPLLPATALPVARTGALSRMLHAAGAHPVTQRIDGAMSRWRKVAPVGGGGSAAIAAKLATAGAIATVSGFTAALHAITSHPPAHPHVRHVTAHHLAIHRLAGAPNPSTPARAASTVTSRPVLRPAAYTTTTTSTTTLTTTSTRAAAPPPPNANPLPATSGRSRTGQDGVRATVASATATGSSQGSSSDAYAPAPNENTVSSTSSSHATNGGAASSGPAAPGGPPAP